MEKWFSIVWWRCLWFAVGWFFWLAKLQLCNSPGCCCFVSTMTVWCTVELQSFRLVPRTVSRLFWMSNPSLYLILTWTFCFIWPYSWAFQGWQTYWVIETRIDPAQEGMDLRQKSIENISPFKIAEVSTSRVVLLDMHSYNCWIPAFLGTPHFFDKLSKECILYMFKFLMRNLEEDNAKKCKRRVQWSASRALDWKCKTKCLTGSEKPCMYRSEFCF